MNTPKPLHIFKPGRHIAMSGEAVEFTEADLVASARAYDPKLHEAPLVIGHPKTDDPARGWVHGLAASDRGLFADPRKVDPSFAESVNKGEFGKISAKFYRPDSPNNPVPGVWYLRHVGFLGAQPPAVKGLDSPEFAEDDDSVSFLEAVEFGDWGLETNASLWRRLREWFIGQFGQEAADQVVPDWQIESIREAAAQDKSAPAFTEGNPANPKKETPAVTPEQAAAIAAENQRLKDQLAARDKQDQDAARQRRHDDNAAFAEELVGAGTLAPKHTAAVVALLDDASRDGDSVEFGEGDQKQPLSAALKAFLKELPPVVEFGESATSARAARDSKTNPLLADAEARAAASKE